MGIYKNVQPIICIIMKKYLNGIEYSGFNLTSLDYSILKILLKIINFEWIIGDLDDVYENC
ncbi:hypothetical protein BpHYR1_008235 [Brachionus plicatilis]|uniref:Uncharacterized protein n=1 Tax=Brachionus plicatilis TaxID=10195 RepID=A0A3M7Q5L7_BRAPC|nr:hypothetical protein BpHYR1_008235 [Brachionus plicatilis]